MGLVPQFISRRHQGSLWSLGAITDNAPRLISARRIAVTGTGCRCARIILTLYPLFPLIFWALRLFSTICFQAPEPITLQRLAYTGERMAALQDWMSVASYSAAWIRNLTARITYISSAVFALLQLTVVSNQMFVDTFPLQNMLSAASVFMKIPVSLMEMTLSGR